MAGLAELFDRLYTRFLLRDVTAKAIPGFMILFVVTSNLTTPCHAVALLGSLPVWGLILVAGLAWVAGFCVQGAGERCGLLSMKSGYDNYGNIAAMPKEARGELLQIIERLTVVKEACGNCYVATWMCVVLCLADFGLSAVFPSSSSWSQEMAKLGIGLADALMFTVVLVSLSYFLRWMHFANSERSVTFVQRFANGSPAQAGNSGLNA